MPVEDRRSQVEASSPPANKRRSPRVVAGVPVQVGWVTSEGFQVTTLAHTSVLNAHGALLSIKSPLAIPAQLEVARPDGSEAIAAHVVDTGNFSPNVPTRVAVELASPSETLWGIPIPPISSKVPH
jgi:hypothetical protein